jgi:hypothetical protein
MSNNEEYEKRILPLLDQIEVIAKELNINGFTIFDLDDKGGCVGTSWPNMGMESVIMHICNRMVTDMQFTHNIRTSLEVLSMSDSALFTSEFLKPKNAGFHKPNGD